MLPGGVRPRVEWAPPSVSSSGAEAVELAASVGLILDDWQAYAVDLILGESADGRWSAFETGVLVARQNGKGGIIEAIELAALFILDERLILHSAHEFKTAKEAFIRLRGLIESSPDLMGLVKQFRFSNEETSVELWSGARLRFMARSRSSGRGFSAGRLIVDEAQVLSSAAMGAILPTLSAQVNPQLNYFGTVPGPGDVGEHFVGVRDRGRAGGDGSLLWLEWSTGGEVSPDVDDRSLWAAANPGLRTSMESLALQRAAMSPDYFAREFLSWWPTVPVGRGVSVVDPGVWRSLGVVDDGRGGWLGAPVTLGVSTARDGSVASIGAAGVVDGRVGVELVARHPGTDWVVDRVVELGAAHSPKGVVIYGGSAAASLIRPLTERGVVVTEISGRDMARSSGAFLADIQAGLLTHRCRPALDEAVSVVRRRPLGDAWAWDQRTDDDVSALVSVTLAHWGHNEIVAPVPDLTGAVW